MSDINTVSLFEQIMQLNIYSQSGYPAKIKLVSYTNMDDHLAFFW